MPKMIRVGDKVLHRGAWGSERATEATITQMELCAAPRMKSGDEVDEVDARLKDRLCVTLDNGHWAYGFQIARLPKSST